MDRKEGSLSVIRGAGLGVVLLGALVTATGCPGTKAADDGGADSPDGGPGIDAGPGSDSGPQPDAGPCGPESCNGRDDDCDGSIDEDLGHTVGEACDADGDGCLDDAWACGAAGEIACTQGAATSDDLIGRMGVDYFRPMHYADAESPDYAATEIGTWTGAYSRLADAGVRWINFTDINWELVDENGWEQLDEATVEWERAGFHVVISLTVGQHDDWYVGGIPGGGVSREVIDEICAGDAQCEALFDCQGASDFCSADRLPERIDPYEAWIERLVERYDCDGRDDAAGLTYPIRHYQVGSEYSNIVYWAGTLADYETLLRATGEAARRASPETILVSNGIRWNDLFHGDPEGSRFEERYSEHVASLRDPVLVRGYRWHRAFTEGTVALAALYDILDAGGNGPYSTATAGYARWVDQELAGLGLTTRIWDMEARAEPQLLFNDLVGYHCELQVTDHDDVLSALWAEVRNGTGDESLIRWYRAEQASELVRVLARRFAEGFETVVIGMAGDWNWSPVWPLTTANAFLGLLDTHGEEQAAFFAYELAGRMLDGFSQVETLQERQRWEGHGEVAVAADGVVLHRFGFDDGRPDLLVTWLAEERTHGDCATARGPRDDVPSIPLALVPGGPQLPAAAGGAYCLYPTPEGPSTAAPGTVAVAAGDRLSLDVTPRPLFVVPSPDGTCQ